LRWRAKKKLLRIIHFTFNSLAGYCIESSVNDFLIYPTGKDLTRWALKPKMIFVVGAVVSTELEDAKRPGEASK
jgi:hypothetical protein